VLVKNTKKRSGILSDFNLAAQKVEVKSKMRETSRCRDLRQVTDRA
jgi:hypothetical protein